MSRRQSKRSSPTLPEPINRFVEAVNHGDTEAFLAFFPERGVVNDEGRRFVGHEAIRRWSDREFIGAKGRMTVTGVKQTRNEIRITADWKSSYYTGASRFVFLVDGEQIREVRIAGS